MVVVVVVAVATSFSTTVVVVVVVVVVLVVVDYDVVVVVVVVGVGNSEEPSMNQLPPRNSMGPSGCFGRAIGRGRALLEPKNDRADSEPNHGAQPWGLAITRAQQLLGVDQR